MRTIDADVLKAAFETDGYLSPYMQRMIDACPTVENVRRGSWIPIMTPFQEIAALRCSECRWVYDKLIMTYCPNCGALMAGKRNDNV